MFRFKLFVFFLGIQHSIFSYGINPIMRGEDFEKPLQRVATVGAATSGPLIEATVGSLHKGCRHRFCTHTAGTTLGFLGPKSMLKPLTLKNQPGIFPAPLMGPAALTFSFFCQIKQGSIIPIVVKPDGTIFQGVAMTQLNSYQSLVVAAPAQTGLYTLFVLAHQKEACDSLVTVDAKINTQPQHDKTFFLKAFEKCSEDFSLCSAEFVYVPL